MVQNGQRTGCPRAYMDAVVHYKNGIITSKAMRTQTRARRSFTHVDPNTGVTGESCMGLAVRDLVEKAEHIPFWAPSPSGNSAGPSLGQPDAMPGVGYHSNFHNQTDGIRPLTEFLIKLLHKGLSHPRDVDSRDVEI